MAIFSKSIVISLMLLSLIQCKNSNQPTGEFAGKTMNLKDRYPKPTFDRDVKDMVNEYSQTYKADAVTIARPVLSGLDGQSTFWLKIDIVNPKVPNKPFIEIGDELALDVFHHLVNQDDFDRIQVTVIKKTGVIFTYSSSESRFFYRDSLQNN
jgi:hypothetical protein